MRGECCNSYSRDVRGECCNSYSRDHHRSDRMRIRFGLMCFHCHRAIGLGSTTSPSSSRTGAPTTRSRRGARRSPPARPASRYVSVSVHVRGVDCQLCSLGASARASSTDHTHTWWSKMTPAAVICPLRADPGGGDRVGSEVLGAGADGILPRRAARHPGGPLGQPALPRARPPQHSLQ